MSANLSKNLNEQKKQTAEKKLFTVKQKIAIGFLAASSIAFIVLFVIFPDSFFAILAVYFIAVMIFNILYNSGFTAETTVFYVLCCAVSFVVYFAFCSVKQNSSNFEASLYAETFLLVWIGYSELYNVKKYKHNKLYTQTVEGTLIDCHEYEVNDGDDIAPHTTTMYQRIWQFEFNNKVYTEKGTSDTAPKLSKGTKQKLIINPAAPSDFSDTGSLYGKKQFIRAWIIGLIPLAIAVFIILDMKGII